MDQNTGWFWLHFLIQIYSLEVLPLLPLGGATQVACLFVGSVTQHTFIEHLLRSSFCFRCWESSSY